ncbi:hypothetical protein [uncultured Aquimarina sp.]|uniref:hypothetical protein n=1 Tax=uncultured Aquimarina sp. TaxID=575652 RepID=UPI002623E2BB|nr:hypothetical protein [uncultured Aquimarina sp.]
MNLQKLDGKIILRVIIIFIIGIGYGVLDRGEFNASFIGYGLSHLVLSYLLGLISFYAYKFIARKKFIDKKKRKVVIWNISMFWALFILIWLGIL